MTVRQLLMSNKLKPQLIVISLAFVCEDGWFKSRRWTYCVLDEGHKIKNSETNLAHRVQGIGALYRLSKF